MNFVAERLERMLFVWNVLILRLSAIKKGDLVKLGNDPDFFFGFGVVVDILRSGKLAKIYWFDNFSVQNNIDWEQTTALEVMSEGG